MYEGSTSTEVVLPDQPKAVQFETVSFTEDGERTKKLVVGTSLRDHPRLKTLLPKIRQLAAQYTEPMGVGSSTVLAESVSTPVVTTVAITPVARMPEPAGASIPLGDPRESGPVTEVRAEAPPRVAAS
jgi:hypothetical protein